jgi:RND family efflux transporter MFP subunit
MTIKYIFLSLLVIVFFGCHNHAPKTANEHDHQHETEEHNHEAEHAHNHGEVKLKLTSYSPEMEVFAEADPFSAGNPSEILAHFTFLKNFKPVKSGSITATLQAGGKQVSQTIDAPLRPGIFLFELKPEATGAGVLSFTMKTDSGQFEVTVPEIQVYADGHDAIHGALDSEEAEPANSIAFTKEQSWKIDFATELPVSAPFGQVIKTTALVENSPDEEELIAAKTSGIVRFANKLLTEGQGVSAGQNLFIVSADELADNNSATRFAEVKNNYEKAKSDFERMTELAKEKIISEKELLEGRTNYENAKAAFDNLNSHFNPKGQTVKSTKSGFIKQLFAQNGQFVEAGQPLVSVTKNQKLILRANVQQKYAPALALVNSAILRIPGSGQTFTLEELGGKILSYGKSAQSGHFLIPVVLQVNNTGIFTPGAFAEVFLKADGGAPALVVPNPAIMEEQGNYFVFVQVNPELFEKREIVPGNSDGQRTEIRSGLGTENRVVTRGAVLVKLAQSSGARDAHSGHVH